MGEATIDLTSDHDPDELEIEVEDIRDDLTGVVRELDRRRHALFDWRQQAKAHVALLSFAALGLALIVGGSLARSISSRRRRARPLYKARQLREAVGRMIEHPELVARAHPTVGKKALSAAVSSVAAVSAKALAQRIVRLS